MKRGERGLVCEVVVAEGLVHVGQFRFVVRQNRFHVGYASLGHFENSEGRSQLMLVNNIVGDSLGEKGCEQLHGVHVVHSLCLSITLQNWIPTS